MKTLGDLENAALEELEAENQKLGNEIDAIREQRKVITTIIDRKLTEQRVLAKMNGLSEEELSVVVRLGALKAAAKAHEPA